MNKTSNPSITRNTIEAVVYTENEAEHYCQTHVNHWYEKVNTIDERSGAATIVFVVYKEINNG